MPSVLGILRYSVQGEAPAPLTYAVETEGGDAVLTYAVNGGPTEAARGLAQYCNVGWRVEVDGAELAGIVALSVNRSVHQVAQTWSLTRSLPGNAVWPWGDNPLNTFAPSIGLREVDIFGVYQTPAGTFLVPRIKGGLAHSERISIEVTAQGPRYTHVLSGTCGAGRFDGLLATLDYPRGHGLSAARLAELLLRQVGVTQFALEPDGPAYGLYQPRDTPALAEAADLMERLGRALHRDAEGRFRNTRIGVRGDAPLEFELHYDPLSLSSGGLGGIQDVVIEIRGDVPTRQTLTAEVQLVREAEAACGRETAPPVEVWADKEYAPRRAAYVVDGLGDLDATGVAQNAATLRRVSRTVATLETQCGVTRSEGNYTEAWRWVEAPRRRWTGAVFINRTGVFLAADADAGGGGAEPAYGPAWEMWSRVGEALTTHFYHDPAWLGPDAGPGPPQGWDDHFNGGLGVLGAGSPIARYYLGSITDEKGWHFRRVPLKQRADTTPWDDVAPIANVLVRGNGEAVAGVEVYERIRRRVVTVQGSEGKIDRSVRYTYEWHRPQSAAFPAPEYQWSDGLEGGFPTEVFGLVDIEETSYLEQGGMTIAVTVKTNMVTGEVSRPEGRRSKDGRPAWDRLPDEAVNLELYGTPEEAEAARQARAGETRQVKVDMEVPGALAYHRPRHDKGKVDGIESESELARMVTDVLVRGMSISISATISPNFQMREGMWGTLQVEPLSASVYEVQLDSLSEGIGGPQELRKQSISLTLYPKLS